MAQNNQTSQSGSPKSQTRPSGMPENMSSSQTGGPSAVGTSQAASSNSPLTSSSTGTQSKDNSQQTTGAQSQEQTVDQPDRKKNSGLQAQNQAYQSQGSQGANLGGIVLTGEALDALKDTLNKSLNNVIASLEPQLNDFALRASQQAVDQGRIYAEKAYAEVKRQPWYLVGAAAALLVGAAVVIGFGDPDVAEAKRQPVRH